MDKNVSYAMSAYQKELQYMVNTVFYNKRRVSVKPLKSRPQAFQPLKPTNTMKAYRCFAGIVVNCFSIFFPELQKY